MKLGDEVKDELTGYKGILVGITEWLYGCKRAGVVKQTLNKDGKAEETVWFDFDQLKLVKAGKIKGVKISPTPTSSTGGPRDVETRRAPDAGR